MAVSSPVGNWCKKGSKRRVQKGERSVLAHAHRFVKMIVRLWIPTWNLPTWALIKSLDLRPRKSPYSSFPPFCRSLKNLSNKSALLKFTEELTESTNREPNRWGWHTEVTSCFELAILKILKNGSKVVMVKFNQKLWFFRNKNVSRETILINCRC